MTEPKVIDFHTHPVTRSFREALEDLGIDVIADDGFPLPEWSVEAQLAFMDEAGIDGAILSAPTPHIHNGDDEKSCAAARRFNEEVAGICRAHADRLRFTAALPLPCVEGAIAETAYAMDTLDAIGVKAPTNANGVYLGDAAFDPLMEELNRRKALCLIHPCRGKEWPANVITGTVAAIFEYPADTTRAVLNLMANRVMTRFPHIRFVVPHCGSFLPYMLQRFAGVSSVLASMGRMDAVDLDAEFSRLYFDIAGDPEPVALDMLRMVADDGHIVFGSDFPHSPAKMILAKKRHFDGNGSYDGLREQIYRTNGVRLLNGGF